ncbi:hypothetical protein QNI16_35380 [Cytophagaceae bacterium YF14B1]|uniref:Leucine rich repeat protein n=1 Tax=Xanthocytophaga flava TaxID=3048013 RepID=A0AAE3QYK1_9BACT|nr:hypothetical protein [Xanthocytophaga flavus]MDJ1485818.1 hypothetical protein [Xanthocytophaga flavus]
MTAFLDLKKLLLKYPQCIGAKIETKAYGHVTFLLRLVLPHSIDQSLTEELLSTETITDIDEKILEAILTQTHWEVMSFKLEQRNEFVQQLLDNLYQFKNLRKLEYKHPFQMPDGKVSLQGLSFLEIANLNEVEVQVKEPLPTIHTFILGSFQKTDVTPILEALNPDTLQKLELRHAGLTTLPTNLQQFKKLTYLGLTGNKISDLTGISAHTNLKLLNLNNNQLTHIPYELFSLTQLEDLLLNQNPLTMETEIKGKTVLLRLIHWCDENQFPKSLREFFSALLQEKGKQTVEDDMTGLLWALTSDIELLRRKATNQLASILSDSLNQHFTSEKDMISIVGKVKGWSTKDILSQLKKHKIKASDKLSDTTTYVCVGDALTAEQVKTILSKNFRLIVPQHLKEFLEKLETPYLKESGEEMQENLSRLIVSDEESTVKLAAQMMMAGGIPDGLFYQILWLGIRKGTFHWKYFRPLLEKYATAQQYDFIKKYRQKEFDVVINKLLESSEFDIQRVLKAGLQVLYTPIEFRNRVYPPGRTNYYAFRDVFKKSLRLGGDPAQHLYHKMTDGNTLDLLFSSATAKDQFQFAKELQEFKQVEKIICSYACATMPNNVKLLKKMNQLKKLELYKLSQVSVDKQQLAELFPTIEVTLKNYEN